MKSRTGMSVRSNTSGGLAKTSTSRAPGWRSMAQASLPAEREDGLAVRRLPSRRVLRADTHATRRGLVEVIAEPELICLFVECVRLRCTVPRALAVAVVRIAASRRTRHDLVANALACERVRVRGVVDGVVVPGMEAVFMEHRLPECRDPRVGALVKKTVEQRAMRELRDVFGGD